MSAEIMTKSARANREPKAEKKSTVISESFHPTQRDHAAIIEFIEKSEGKPPAPGVTVTQEDGIAAISMDHEDQGVGMILLMSALGTTNPAFMDELLRQLLNAGTQGQNVDARGLDFMLSVVTGVEPKDEVEAMLAAQMAAVHMATMTFARRLAHAENIPQQDSAERTFNKLARTFAAQVGALKHYRTGGEQKVTVEHVTVNEGGQAIVGTIEAGGRGVEKKGGTTP